MANPISKNIDLINDMVIFWAICLVNGLVVEDDDDDDDDNSDGVE